jgi:hypothetical protein
MQRLRGMFFGVAATGLVVVLAGCGAGDRAESAAATSTAPPAALTMSPTVTEPASPTPESVVSDGVGVSPDATVPPGDPGSAPSVVENTSVGSVPAGKTSVPANALLDAQTMEAVVPGRWSIATAPADSCTSPRPSGAAASRTGSLTSGKTRMIETVAIHADQAAASRSIDALSTRLLGCGWKALPETPMGEDSAGFSRSGSSGLEKLVIVAAEGVSTTLQGNGTLSGNDDTWASVLDIAIGTSCPAAPDGCH